MTVSQKPIALFPDPGISKSTPGMDCHPPSCSTRETIVLSNRQLWPRLGLKLARVLAWYSLGTFFVLINQIFGGLEGKTTHHGAIPMVLLLRVRPSQSVFGGQDYGLCCFDAP